MPVSNASPEILATEQYLHGLRQIEAYLAEKRANGRYDYAVAAMRDRLIKIIRERRGG